MNLQEFQQAYGLTAKDCRDSKHLAVAAYNFYIKKSGRLLAEMSLAVFYHKDSQSIVEQQRQRQEQFHHAFMTAYMCNLFAAYGADVDAAWTDYLATIKG